MSIFLDGSELVTTIDLKMVDGAWTGTFDVKLWSEAEIRNTCLALMEDYSEQMHAELVEAREQIRADNILEFAANARRKMN